MAKHRGLQKMQSIGFIWAYLWDSDPLIWDGGDCANSVGFRWSSSLLPYVCPMCVR